MHLMQLLRNNTLMQASAQPGTVVINHFSHWSRWFLFSSSSSLSWRRKKLKQIKLACIQLWSLCCFFVAAFGPNINYHGKLHGKLDILRCAPLDRINYSKLFALITIFITLWCEQRKNAVINRQPMRFCALCLQSFPRQNEYILSSAQMGESKQLNCISSL